MNIKLRSVAELNAHVATLPPYPDVDIWWTCPKCGASNFGVLLAQSALCPECREYAHPPAGTVTYPLVELQIKELEGELGDIDDEISLLEVELSDLYDQASELRDQLKMLRKLRDEGRGGS